MDNNENLHRVAASRFIDMQAIDELMKLYKQNKIDTKTLHSQLNAMGAIDLEPDKFYNIKGEMIIAFLNAMANMAKKKWWQFWR